MYENALVSQVKAGENRGATLHHERVVRQWIGPVPVVDGQARIAQTVKLAADAGANANASAPTAGDTARFGVVAFVERASTGEVEQAAELPIEPGACH